MTRRPPIQGLGHFPQAFQTASGSWNIHASCVTLGSLCFIVSGPASAGKTTLCHRFVDEGAKWVADDRLVMAAGTSSLDLSCPPKLHGLVELPREGPVEVGGMVSVQVPYGNVIWIDLGGRHQTPHLKAISVFAHSVRCVQIPPRPDHDVRALGRMATL
ncbi:MAG: hypothetical protein AAF141_13150 [Pseudomonadota bacterium]